MLTHTHLAGGIAAAAGTALLLGVPPAQTVPLALVAAVGAVLPDIDSPPSKPAQIVALIEGAILGAAAGYYLGTLLPPLVLALLGAGVGAALGGPGLLSFLVVLLLIPAAWRLPGYGALALLALLALAQLRRGRRWSLLSTATHAAGGHRGPTHSLGFLGLALLGGWLLAHFAVLPVVFPWWALGLGVLTHLVLDTLTAGGVRWLWPDKRRLALLPLKTGGLAEHGLVLPLLLVATAWSVGQLAGGYLSLARMLAAR